MILNLIWFKDGNIMGVAESGLPFYDFQIQFNTIKDSWAYYALGYPTNISTSAIPTYWFFAQLQSLGIPSFLIQAFFFWIILVVSGLSIYFLSKEFFPKLNSKIYLLSTLFYWFNPFSLVNVWSRFLNNFIFFYAFLPLAIYLFLKGIKTKKVIYIVLFNLSSAIFAYSLSSLGFVILLWLVLLLILLFYLYLIEKENKLQIIRFFFLCLIYWILINSWWLSQTLSYIHSGSFSKIVSTSFKLDSNYFTFSALSERLGSLIYIFRLKHATFFQNFEQFNWVTIYKFPLLTFLEFVVFGICLMPLVTRRKNVSVLFLGSLFVLSLFFTKGNNPPFGEFFNWLFINFSFLQLFRNPFEKIGFLLPLAAAPLFSLGFYELNKIFKHKFQKQIYVLALIWMIVIWGFPFWTSLVFTGTEYPTNRLDIGYQVKVPESYQQAAVWLSSQKRNFRLLVLPLGGEGITYKWDKGYSGLELSNQILPLSSISFNTNTPFYDDLSRNIERLFLQRDDFYKILDVLNTKYILVRSDIDWQERQMRNPRIIIDRLNELQIKGKFKKVQQFGDLTFWEYLGWQDKTIYTTSKLSKSYDQLLLDDLLIADSAITPTIINTKGVIVQKDLVSSQIVYPTFTFQINERTIPSDFKFREDLIFPAVKFAPSSKFYPLILLKEKVEKQLIDDKTSLLIKLISLLGKRLVEAQIEAEKGDLNSSQKAIDNYLSQLQEAKPYLIGNRPNNKDMLITQNDLSAVFLAHTSAIDKLKMYFSENNIDKINFLEDSLNNILIEKGLVPKFDYQGNNFSPKKNVYQYNIDKEGQYELLLDIRLLNKFYKISLSEPLSVQIDREFTTRTPKFMSNQLISLGLFHFTPGVHELATNLPEAINLINTESEVLLSVNHGSAEKKFVVNSFDPFSEYFLNFNYLIKRGNGLIVNMEQNNDKRNGRDIRATYTKYIAPDRYDFGVQEFVSYFSPSTSADSSNLVFRITPWNNCLEAYRLIGQEKCLNDNFRSGYDQRTDVSISNIGLFKLIKEFPILKYTFNEKTTSNNPTINFTKLNNAEYRVKIKDATASYALIFDQLFDPGWRIITVDGQSMEAKHFLANTYANGWIIDKKGDYEFKLKYSSQDLLQKSEWWSSIVFIGSCIFLTLKIIKKR